MDIGPTMVLIWPCHVWHDFWPLLSKLDMVWSFGSFGTYTQVVFQLMVNVGWLRLIWRVLVLFGGF